LDIVIASPDALAGARQSNVLFIKFKDYFYKKGLFQKIVREIASSLSLLAMTEREIELFKTMQFIVE